MAASFETVKTVTKTLCFLCFVGLATVAALVLDRAVQPSMSDLLLRAVIAAAISGAPGLVHRRAWPAALLLLVLGTYLLLRTTLPMPAQVNGAGEQYRFYAQELKLGASAYIGRYFPLTLTDAPELRLLLTVSVYWLTGTAAFLALSLRRAVPGVALLLVLLGFGLTVDSAQRAPLPALLFLVLAACLLVLCRGLGRETWRLRDALAGGALGVVASLLAFVLVMTAPSAIAAPWQDWRAWNPFIQGVSTRTFNWMQSYPKLLDPANNTPIMTVESPAPSYWRANALDTFTGSAWVSSQAFLTRLEAVPTGGAYAYSIPPADFAPEGKTVTEVFHVKNVYTDYLFAGGDCRSVIIGHAVSLRINDMRSLRVTEAVGPNLEYSVTAVIPEVNPADLVDRGFDYPDALDRYLTLPFPSKAEVPGADGDTAWRSTMSEAGGTATEWLGLYSLNRRIIADATDPYEITLRVEEYLRQSFDYSLAPPASEYTSPYSAFLFDTQSGYCQHFAGAMALLLRYNGIPARVALGFTTGEQDGPNTYLVNTNNAHAWVEVYFPEVGWVAFDPTPGRNIPVAGASSTGPGFINPFTDEGMSRPETTIPQAPADHTINDAETGGMSAKTEGQDHARLTHWLPWVIGLLVALIAWPAVRGLWRRRHLYRGPLEQRLQASLRLLRLDLGDSGLATPPSYTLEETLNLVHAQLGLHPDPAFADRADAVLFGSREATQNDIETAEALRRQVKARLRARRGWVRAGLAWYGVYRLHKAEGTSA